MQGGRGPSGAAQALRRTRRCWSAARTARDRGALRSARRSRSPSSPARSCARASRCSASRRRQQPGGHLHEGHARRGELEAETSRWQRKRASYSREDGRRRGPAPRGFARRCYRRDLRQPGPGQGVPHPHAGCRPTGCCLVGQRMFALASVLAIMYFVHEASAAQEVASQNALGSANTQAIRDLGRNMFLFVFIAQSIMAALITPAITSGTVTIAAGAALLRAPGHDAAPARGFDPRKLAAAVSFVVLLLTASLPLVSLSFLSAASRLRRSSSATSSSPLARSTTGRWESLSRHFARPRRPPS